MRSDALRKRKAISRMAGTLRGRPMPFKRHITRVDAEGKPHGSHPPEYRQWQQIAAAKLSAQASFGEITGPVAVEIVVSAGETRVSVVSVEGQGARPTRVTGDIDNYAKAVLDALQQGDHPVIRDDRQVVSLSVRFGGADEDPTTTV